MAAVRTPFSQLLTRPTLTAAAVANPCRWVLSRNNRELLPKDAGWKDTMDVPPGPFVRLLIRFDGYRGKYAFHCHNLEHEERCVPLRRVLPYVPGPSGSSRPGPW